ncbi:TPA: transposase [Salmonella enterica subsp. enterica serovar Saintpaul]
MQVVSRDRGGIYALAARDGAPQAIQVADRWHLLKNIGDALERMMYRHMPLIRLVATELSQKNRTLKRLWCQLQRYDALNVLNESGVTNAISAGLR